MHDKRILRRSISILLTFATLLLALAVEAQHDCKATKQGSGLFQAKAGGPPALWPMDIIHQVIALDLTMANTIAGHCTITAVPRADGTSNLPLDLLTLTVDSVTNINGTLAFTQSGEILDIDLGGSFNTNDTVILTVHYQGDPTVDASGFGGFYTGTIMYNLGVAFTSVPHSYGRAWFPCVDNFTERNSYDFLIKTNGINSSWCNGELISEMQLGGDTVLRHWSIAETMPSYLASVAASNYVAVRDQFMSTTGTSIPVELVARAQDTTAMKNSFLHLPDAFSHFEDWFGPYRWNKVGYVMTPQGAMEHATSIHYPSSIADGSLQYEDIMAHELAHHWFGDLVTCDRAEEMYINEGFAEYLSYLFLEDVYGRERYMTTVKRNHRTMVHRAHILDEDWLTLSNIPQQWTYGEHVYNKGADVAHALRGYLGDALFIQALTSFLETYAFQPVNTSMLRDHLTQETGIDMTDFFTDWIDQPGWAAFEVDSFNVEQVLGGVWPTNVFVEQKQRGPSSPYNNVPITVTCYDANGAGWDSPQQLFSGSNSSATVLPPFEPVAVVLNADELISLAITLDTDTMESPGILNSVNSDLRVTVVTMPTPTPIVVQEYWVAADPEVDETFAYVVSPDRYWRITVQLPAGAELTGRINYDGRDIISGALDIGLMNDYNGVAFTEDSLVVLYRPSAHVAWNLHPEQTLNTIGSATNKTGRIDINDLQAGEYTLAWRKSSVSVSENAREAVWSIFPNPATNGVLVRTDMNSPNGVIELLDQRGALIRQVAISGNVLVFPLEGISAGTYMLRFASKGTQTNVGPLVIIE